MANNMSIFCNGDASVAITEHLEDLGNPHQVSKSDLSLDTTDRVSFTGLNLVATVWEDLRTPANVARAIVGREADEVVYRGGVVYSFDDGSDEGIAFNVQLPHSYKEGSDIEFHIHDIYPTAGAGAGVENVKWDLTYAWSNISGAIPTETTVTKTIDVQNKAVDTHYLDEVADVIDGTGKEISSMIICSLTRDTSVANNYSDEVYVMEVDFHFQVNTLGSITENSK